MASGDVDDEMDAFEERDLDAAAHDIESLDAQQLHAVQLILDRKNTAVLGRAGSGKSRVLNIAAQMVMDRYLKEGKMRGRAAKMMHVVAPTGKAASLVGGMTVHRLFRVSPVFDKTNGGMTFDGGWKQKLVKYKGFGEMLRGMGTLFVDEISMLDAEFFELLDAMLQTARSRPGQLFGGVQVVVVGDFNQLPPIHKFRLDDTRFDMETRQFCFLSALWPDLFGTTTVLLQTSHRQADDTVFQLMLDRISRGQLTGDDHEALLRRITDADPRDVLHLYAKNKDVERYNIRRMMELTTREFQFCGKVERGEVDAEGKVVKREAMAPGQKSADGLEMEDIRELEDLHSAEWRLCLKEGCRILVIANVCVETGIVNGATGVFHGMGSTGATMLVEMDGIGGAVSWRTEIGPREYVWPASGKKDDVRRKVYTQYPVRLGYAITVHRAQGMTLDAVHLGTGFFEPNHFYVALSRVKRLESVTLDAFLPSWVVSNPVVAKYYRELGAV